MEASISTLGNKSILKLYKTAFLCSRQIPASIVLKSYDWAIQQREAGKCVVSGFHSPIEKDVFYYLLKGKQPLIMALARGLKERIEPELRKPLDEGRLLIVSPFEKNIKRITKETAFIRNKMMVELADSIVVGYIKPGGLLDVLLNNSGKNIRFI